MNKTKFFMGKNYNNKKFLLKILSQEKNLQKSERLCVPNLFVSNMKKKFFENFISAKQETLGGQSSVKPHMDKIGDLFWWVVFLKTFNDLILLPVTSSSPLTAKVTFIQQTWNKLMQQRNPAAHLSVFCCGAERQRRDHLNSEQRVNIPLLSGGHEKLIASLHSFIQSLQSALSLPATSFFKVSLSKKLNLWAAAGSLWPLTPLLKPTPAARYTARETIIKNELVEKFLLTVQVNVLFKD